MILAVDGDCLLCLRSLRWFLQRLRGDSRLVVYPARIHGIGAVRLLVTGGRWSGSSAVLQACRELRTPWPLAAALLVIPQPLREGVYRWIAGHRYAWFGQQQACVIADDQLRSRLRPRSAKGYLQQSPEL